MALHRSGLALHVIPVPRGWSAEQAWEAISRGDLLGDPEPFWGVVQTRDGSFVTSKFSETLDGEGE